MKVLRGFNGVVYFLKEGWYLYQNLNFVKDSSECAHLGCGRISMGSGVCFDGPKIENLSMGVMT